MEVQTSLKKSNRMKKKKKFERERENLFVWEKNMHKMGKSDKFIVRGWE